MTIHTSPARARSDARDLLDAPTSRPISQSAVRRSGAALSLGAAAWAASMVVLGTNPTGGRGVVVGNLTALAFQLGVLCLLRVQVRTRATGTGAFARRFFHVEHVLLVLAMGSSVVDAFHGASTVLGAVLDPFWPLSMLGMCAIGVRLAIAGRWRGVVRYWPLVAESWAVVTVPVYGIAPHAAQYVGSAHLLVGYVVLGLLLVRHPELTGAHDVA